MTNVLLPIPTAVFDAGRACISNLEDWLTRRGAAKRPAAVMRKRRLAKGSLDSNANKENMPPNLR